MTKGEFPESDFEGSEPTLEEKISGVVEAVDGLEYFDEISLGDLKNIFQLGDDEKKVFKSIEVINAVYKKINFLLQKEKGGFGSHNDNNEVSIDKQEPFRSINYLTEFFELEGTEELKNIVLDIYTDLFEIGKPDRAICVPLALHMWEEEFQTITEGFFERYLMEGDVSLAYYVAKNCAGLLSKEYIEKKFDEAINKHKAEGNIYLVDSIRKALAQYKYERAY